MRGRPARTLKQEQAQLRARLLADGRSWVDMACIFRQRYRVNARVAFRLAHGWTQREAARRWTVRWPKDPKTNKQVSHWEQWPSSTGYAPTLATLDRLAQLYECSIADLLADCPTYGSQEGAATG